MSTVATQATRGLEVTIAHLNLLGRVIAGADSVSVDAFGEVRIQGNIEALADVPTTLGLERNERRDNTSYPWAFRIWDGRTSSAFGNFETTLVMVERMPVEIPADCDAASLS